MGADCASVSRRELVLWGIVPLTLIHLGLYLPNLWAAPYFIGDDFSCFAATNDQQVPAILLWLHHLGDRPLRHLYFTVMGELVGFNPLPYHLISCVLQLVNVLLVVALVRAIGASLQIRSASPASPIHPRSRCSAARPVATSTGTRDAPCEQGASTRRLGPESVGRLPGQRTRVAITAALLFSVHYQNTAVTLSIRQVDALLFVTFAILSVLAFRRAVPHGSGRERRRAFGLFVLAMLTTASALALPLILTFLHRVWSAGTWRATLRRVAPYYAVAALFILHNVGFMLLFKFVIDAGEDVTTSQGSLALFAGGAVTRFLNLATHLKLFLIPFDFQGPDDTFWWPRSHSPILSLCLLAPLALLLLSRTLNTYRFCLLWFLLCIGPFLWSPYTPVKERYLYAPMVGGSILVAMIIWHATELLIRRYGRGAAAAGVVVVIMLSGSLGMAWRGRADRRQEAGEITRGAVEAVQRTVAGDLARRFHFFVAFPVMHERMNLFPGSHDLLAALYPEARKYGSVLLAPTQLPRRQGKEGPWAGLAGLQVPLPAKEADRETLERVSGSAVSYLELPAILAAIPREWRLNAYLFNGGEVEEITDRIFSRWRVELEVRVPGASRVKVVGLPLEPGSSKGELKRASDGTWRGEVEVLAGRRELRLSVDGLVRGPLPDDMCRDEGTCTPSAWVLPLVNRALPPGAFGGEEMAFSRRLETHRRQVLLHPGSEHAHRDLANLYRRNGYLISADIEAHLAERLTPGGEARP